MFYQKAKNGEWGGGGGGGTPIKERAKRG